jgi:uncharacterized protein (DUF1330 family)
MPKGYWIVSVDISNPDSYKHYIAENRNAFRKYGALFYVEASQRLSRVRDEHALSSLSSGTTQPHYRLFACC